MSWYIVISSPVFHIQQPSLYQLFSCFLCCIKIAVMQWGAYNSAHLHCRHHLPLFKQLFWMHLSKRSSIMEAETWIYNNKQRMNPPVLIPCSTWRTDFCTYDIPTNPRLWMYYQYVCMIVYEISKSSERSILPCFWRGVATVNHLVVKICIFLLT